MAVKLQNPRTGETMTVKGTNSKDDVLVQRFMDQGFEVAGTEEDKTKEEKKSEIQELKKDELNRRKQHIRSQDLNFDNPNMREALGIPDGLSEEESIKRAAKQDVNEDAREVGFNGFGDWAEKALEMKNKAKKIGVSLTSDAAFDQARVEKDRGSPLSEIKIISEEDSAKSLIKNVGSGPTNTVQMFRNAQGKLVAPKSEEARMYLSTNGFSEVEELNDPSETGGKWQEQRNALNNVLNKTSSPDSSRDNAILYNRKKDEIEITNTEDARQKANQNENISVKGWRIRDERLPDVANRTQQQLTGKEEVFDEDTLRAEGVTNGETITRNGTKYKMTSDGLRLAEAEDTSDNNNVSEEDDQKEISQDLLDSIPQKVRDLPSWKSMSTEGKKTLASTFKLAQDPGVSDEQFNNIVEQAKQVADPIIKQQLEEAKESLQRTRVRNEEDAQKSIQRKEDRIKEIENDLQFNKEQLTLEQQNELAQIKNQQEQELRQMKQKFAEAGLAFSSPRRTAESRTRQSQSLVRESTRRQFEQRKRNLQKQSERNIEKQEQSIEDIQTKTDRNLEDVREEFEKLTGVDLDRGEGVQDMSLEDISKFSQFGQRRAQKIANIFSTATGSDDPEELAGQLESINT